MKTLQDTEKNGILFRLDDFFPYQTRLFYRKVSSAVSEVYTSRYAMKPYEWRTIAILGEHGEFTANEIVAQSSMDKVSVSRAISALDHRNWLSFKKNKSDGRSRLISLSEAGIAAYAELVPEMLAVEKRILSAYSEGEIAVLRRLFDRLKDHDVK